jgi:hypothetical protein
LSPRLLTLTCLHVAHSTPCRYFRLSASTLPFDVYVISMDGAADRLASFQRSYEASDLSAKNVVRFPAVNGSALDAGRLVTPKALEEMQKGGCCIKFTAGTAELLKAIVCSAKLRPCNSLSPWPEQPDALRPTRSMLQRRRAGTAPSTTS